MALGRIYFLVVVSPLNQCQILIVVLCHNRQTEKIQYHQSNNITCTSISYYAYAVSYFIIRLYFWSPNGIHPCPIASFPRYVCCCNSKRIDLRARALSQSTCSHYMNNIYNDSTVWWRGCEWNSWRIIYLHHSGTIAWGSHTIHNMHVNTFYYCLILYLLYFPCVAGPHHKL